MPLLHFSPFAARLGATLAVLGALTACTRQPAPAAPPPVLQANPLADLPAGVSQQPLPAQWWALFQDPQLNRWVQLALAHNQDLAQADSTVQAMLAGIGEFDARRWPATAVEVGATYGKSADDQTLAEATESHAPSQWQFSPGIERARAQADASAAARDLVRLQVVTQTSRAYLAQCVYGARLAQARQSLQSLERSVQLGERQQQAGVATALDSERLLGLREQVRAQLPMLVARRQMALYELAMLSGQAAAAPVGDCSAIPTVSVPLPLGDGWRLLERRPDLRQAERELRAAALETEIARADLYPKVSFGASLTSSAAHLADLGDSRAVMFGIGPLIHWQFPNLKANRARVGKARALQQAQIARYQGVALNALKDVRQALARYAGERQRQQALEAALGHSERGFALAQNNYRAGTVDGLALLDSERELIRLRASQVEAQGRLAQAQVDLFRALGGRW